MIASLLVLVVGLGLAGVAAAIGVAAAAVSQVELTRWVHYKLRGTEAAVRLLEHPGRVLATANALTTLGVLVAAAAVPALLAQTTPTFLGVFTVAAVTFVLRVTTLTELLLLTVSALKVVTPEIELSSAPSS